MSRHQLVFRRYSSSVDANYTPNPTATEIARTKGVCHEYSAAEMPGAGGLGQKTVAFAIFPYRVGPVRDQDLCDVTFKDGTTRTFRVVTVRDNHIIQRADLERVND